LYPGGNIGPEIRPRILSGSLTIAEPCAMDGIPLSGILTMKTPFLHAGIARASGAAAFAMAGTTIITIITAFAGASG
jgi:hypothetical protein